MQLSQLCQKQLAYGIGAAASSSSPMTAPLGDTLSQLEPSFEQTIAQLCFAKGGFRSAQEELLSSLASQPSRDSFRTSFP